MVAVCVFTRAQVITAYAAAPREGCDRRLRFIGGTPGLGPDMVAVRLPRSNAAVQTQRPIHRRRRASMAASTLLLKVPTGDLQGATADGSSTPVTCAQASSNWF